MLKTNDELVQAYIYDEPPLPAEDNRYGSPIDLTANSGLPAGQSLTINGDTGVGTNPDRNKQHGFHFTADNCIGCHACEAACSEKNGLPAHLSFRSVGYVEGGSYPDYTRMNISMACNHCDDPVCLKGCPTRAYTKFAEYGAVLQDPDICFGCGYCTWVCPYNAPQLDPIEGHVQKCNMCVDRLEEGLKPACVSACLGNALEFGVIEEIPKNREQAKTNIPGFPDASITHPNIRFQQTKSIPGSFTRPDSGPLKYHRNDEIGRYLPEVDLDKVKTKRTWNITKLNSRENPLVVFTLTTQAVVGAFVLMFLGAQFGIESFSALTSSPLYPIFLFGLLALQAGVLVYSTLHLGKPLRFYRGFNNLRHSPLSREALGISLFLNAAGAHWIATLLSQGLLPWTAGLIPDWIATSATTGFGWAAVLTGLGGIYFMNRIYRIKARPFWDHWQVASSFLATMLSLGGMIIASVWLPYAVFSTATLATILGSIIAVGLAIEATGLSFHARAMKSSGGEGAAAHHEQTTRFGYTYLARNALLGLSIAGATALAIATPTGWLGLALWAVCAMTIMVTALIGRALFYVLVIPTTMPGAFFWKNKAFQEHARETGLANMPQVGVLPDAH